MRAHAHAVHAVRVSLVATLIVAAAYAAAAAGLDLFVAKRLTSHADTRLSDVLLEATHPPSGGALSAVANDPDDTPVFLWQVSTTGVATAVTPHAPALAPRKWQGADPAPVTVKVGTVPFRLDARPSGSGWLVAGVSVADVGRVQSALVLPEVGVGVGVLLAIFVGALVVGLRAQRPLEVVRRRQAEFTADASHELRTPLAVVEAEIDLALRRARAPAEYERVLQRIGEESARLHRIVDDLMWLARADASEDPIEPGEGIDLGEAAAACVERFGAVAARHRVSLECRRGGGDPTALVDVPAEWLDRLLGVLVDNAVKYAGEGGRVVVEASATAGRVVLRVDDSGPGIAPEDRDAVFRRFHRATDRVGGAGLGLAIADSVVRRTGGARSVGDSPLGGARLEVSWRRAPTRRPMPRRRVPEPALD